MRSRVAIEGPEVHKLVPATHLLYSGRTLVEAASRRFDWPGVSVHFRSTTTAAHALIDETQTNRYAVWLSESDKAFERHSEISTNASLNGQPYELFSGLPAVARRVLVLKLTEACGEKPRCEWCPPFGTATFGGVLVDAGAQLLRPNPPWREGRRLAFYGDSITVGWGARGGSGDRECDDGEDHGAAWGVVLSRMLAAEFHSVAWSGIGLLLNDAADSPDNRTMPRMATATLGNFPTAAAVVPSAWRPSALLVHLGTNDFTPGHDIDVAAFATAYIALLLNLTLASSSMTASKVAPAAAASISGAGAPPVFAACGPMGTLGDHRGAYFPCAAIWSQLATLGAEHSLRIHPLDFRGLYEVEENIGGCNHPSVQGQLRMAQIARPVLEEALGWKEK